MSRTKAMRETFEEKIMDAINEITYDNVHHIFDVIEAGNPVQFDHYVKMISEEFYESVDFPEVTGVNGIFVDNAVRSVIFDLYDEYQRSLLTAPTAVADEVDDDVKEEQKQEEPADILPEKCRRCSTHKTFEERKECHERKVSLMEDIDKIFGKESGRQASGADVKKQPNKDLKSDLFLDFLLHTLLS